MIITNQTYKYSVPILFRCPHDCNAIIMPPIKSVKLLDGTEIPRMAYGTGSALYKQDCTDAVRLALSVGFGHIDAAQVYENEHQSTQHRQLRTFRYIQAEFRSETARVPLLSSNHLDLCILSTRLSDLPQCTTIKNIKTGHTNEI